MGWRSDQTHGSPPRVEEVLENRLPQVATILALCASGGRRNRPNQSPRAVALDSKPTRKLLTTGTYSTVRYNEFSSIRPVARALTALHCILSSSICQILVFSSDRSSFCANLGHVVSAVPHLHCAKPRHAQSGATRCGSIH